jgi:RNA polymerase sigma factor (sigma-70 family)
MSRTRHRNREDRAQAFDALVSHYEAPLLRYAARIVGNEYAAQDIVQNTFIRLFTSWKEALSVSPQLSSWLYRVAHNQAVDHIRREARRRMLHRRHGEETPTAAPPDRGRAFAVSEAAARADAALGVLSLRERQLVVLKVYEELSYKAISEITGLSMGNVGYILHHAMKKLAAALGGRKAAREGAA